MFCPEWMQNPHFCYTDWQLPWLNPALLLVSAQMGPLYVAWVVGVSLSPSQVVRSAFVSRMVA